MPVGMVFGSRAILLAALATGVLSPGLAVACDEAGLVTDLVWCMDRGNVAKYAKNAHESVELPSKLLGMARGGSVDQGRAAFRVCHGGNPAAVQRIGACDDPTVKRAAARAYNRR